jgi:hypothetical protein
MLYAVMRVLASTNRMEPVIRMYIHKIVEPLVDTRPAALRSKPPRMPKARNDSPGCLRRARAFFITGRSG